MSNPIEITISELRSILLGLRSTAIVSFVAATDPKFKAKAEDGRPNPYRIGKGATASSLVHKVVKYSGHANPDYDRMVVNEHARSIIAERIEANLPPLSAEGLQAAASERADFGTSWHRVVKVDGRPTAIAVHKDAEDDGAAYLRFVLKASGASEYVSKASGEAVDRNDVRCFESKPSSYANQNLGDDAKRFMLFALSGIIDAAIDGQRYRIVDNLAALSEAARQSVLSVADEYLQGERRMSKV